MKKISEVISQDNNIRDSKDQRGFLELIVVIIIALVLLNVLGFNMKEFLAKPWVHEYGVYAAGMLKLVWQDILQIVAFVKDLFV